MRDIQVSYAIVPDFFNSLLGRLLPYLLRQPSQRPCEARYGSCFVGFDEKGCLQHPGQISPQAANSYRGPGPDATREFQDRR